MKRKKEENGFNFWPAFGDFTILVTSVLLLSLFLYKEADKEGENRRHMAAQAASLALVNSLRVELGDDASVFQPEEIKDYIQVLRFKSSLLFETGSATLKDQRSVRIIQTVGKILKRSLANQEIERIIIEGHTDKQPFANQPLGNWTLSATRAVSIVEVLDQMHIRDMVKGQENRRVISIQGFSEYDPVSSNIADNRRIQFSIKFTGVYNPLTE